MSHHDEKHPNHNAPHEKHHGHPHGEGASQEELAFADDLNSRRPFVMWAVFAAGALPAGEAASLASDVVAKVHDAGVHVRGYYDLSGYRADADLMAWFIADTPEQLQAAYRALTLSNLGLKPVWSVIAQHKPAEFNKLHLPGMFLHEDAPKYAAVYPFVRSYDWYLLEPWKRASIMRNHGMAGREFDDLVTSTLATFSLSDYEWVVSVEGDSLTRLVDLMYAFRNTEARKHVRLDTPFFTGVLTELPDWAARHSR